MTTEAVWSAVADLAEAWAQTPLIQELNTMTLTGTRSKSGIAKLLQELDAGGAQICGHPLALATQVRYGLSVQPYAAKDVRAEELGVFRGLSQRVEVVHFSTVAWMRSRLPGYPMLTSPQLVRESAWTTEAWTHRYPWRRADLAAGLQYQDQLETASLLGSLEGVRFAPLTTALSSALKETPEWLVFGAARAGLTSSDLDQLKAACAELRGLLAADTIDRYEPNLAVRRAQYREHHTRHVVESMTGPAGAYARALGAVNDIIDLVTVDVLAQLTRFGRPVSVVPTSLALDEAGENWITADLTDEMHTVFIRPGRLVQLANPLTPDLIRVESTSFTMNDVTTRIRIRGRVLPNSRSLLTRTS
jgi:hypothetical protein